MMPLTQAKDIDRRCLSLPNNPLRFLPKLLKRGPPREEEKVRLAPAIRRAESSDGNGGSPQRADNASPSMLATNPVVRIPDPVETAMGSQVINVPVRSRRQPLMVRDAGSDTSRPHRAAHVNVEPSSKLQWAEFPYLDRPFLGTEKDQSVGAAFCRHDRSARCCRRSRRHRVSALQLRNASLCEASLAGNSVHIRGVQETSSQFVPG
jgi:hypothetical protein